MLSIRNTPFTVERLRSGLKRLWVNLGREGGGEERASSFLPQHFCATTKERRGVKMRSCCRAQTLVKEQWQNRPVATAHPDPAMMTSNSWFCFEVCLDSVPLG